MALVIGQFKLGNLWRSHNEVLNLIVSHLHRYPQMDVEDTYTLLYQGAMGPAHLGEALLFGGQLEKEFNQTPLYENIPLWENLRPDGEIVRLNLTPYKLRGGEVGALSTLCLWTISSFKGNLNNLKDSWETYKRLCRDGRLSMFDTEKLAQLDEWVVSQGYPPARHSPRYRALYQPAYRLVRREFLNLIPSGK